MTKRERRLQKIRQNPRNVSYNDLIAVLEDFGFAIRSGKGSHVYVRCDVGEQVWTATLVKPHGSNKHVNQAYVKRIITILDEVNAALAERDTDHETEEQEDNNGN